MNKQHSTIAGFVKYVLDEKNDIYFKKLSRYKEVYDILHVLYEDMNVDNCQAISIDGIGSMFIGIKGYTDKPYEVIEIQDKLIYILFIDSILDEEDQCEMFYKLYRFIDLVTRKPIIPRMETTIYGFMNRAIPVILTIKILENILDKNSFVQDIVEFDDIRAALAIYSDDYVDGINDAKDEILTKLYSIFEFTIEELIDLCCINNL